ncbi:MAG: hypothetical protein Q9208_002437 [Pyrenodesmia sp. 3 TL-2023]
MAASSSKWKNIAQNDDKEYYLRMLSTHLNGIAGTRPPPPQVQGLPIQRAELSRRSKLAEQIVDLVQFTCNLPDFAGLSPELIKEHEDRVQEAFALKFQLEDEKGKLPPPPTMDHPHTLIGPPAPRLNLLRPQPLPAFTGSSNLKELRRQAQEKWAKRKALDPQVQATAPPAQQETLGTRKQETLGTRMQESLGETSQVQDNMMQPASAQVQRTPVQAEFDDDTRRVLQQMRNHPRPLHSFDPAVQAHMHPAYVPGDRHSILMQARAYQARAAEVQDSDADLAAETRETEEEKRIARVEEQRQKDAQAAAARIIHTSQLTPASYDTTALATDRRRALPPPTIPPPTSVLVQVPPVALERPVDLEPARREQESLRPDNTHPAIYDASSRFGWRHGYGSAPLSSWQPGNHDTIEVPIPHVQDPTSSSAPLQANEAQEPAVAPSIPRWVYKNDPPQIDLGKLTNRRRSIKCYKPPKLSSHRQANTGRHRLAQHYLVMYKIEILLHIAVCFLQHLAMYRIQVLPHCQIGLACIRETHSIHSCKPLKVSTRDHGSMAHQHLARHRLVPYKSQVVLVRQSNLSMPLIGLTFLPTPSSSPHLVQDRMFFV